MVQNSRIHISKIFLMHMVSLMNSLLHIHRNKMVLLKGRIVLLLKMSRTMLAEYNTPIRFWAEAINTACHIINKVYLHKFLKKTSHELITGNKPNISYLRVFGAPCYIRDMNHSSNFFP